MADLSPPPAAPPVFLHEARFGQCRHVEGVAPWRLTPHGTAYPLAVICAAPVEEGRAWCPAHAARVFQAGTLPPLLPRKARLASAPAGLACALVALALAGWVAVELLAKAAA